MNKLLVFYFLNFFIFYFKLSPSYIYYALGFLSKEFEAFKTSRFSFEKLNTLKFPSSW